MGSQGCKKNWFEKRSPRAEEGGPFFLVYPCVWKKAAREGNLHQQSGTQPLEHFRKGSVYRELQAGGEGKRQGKRGQGRNLFL